jgi:prepilin-type N-terminal cleavage/methylation domain-containing protein
VKLRLGQRRRGFTLPEVLATMVLVGAILPASMRAITVAMQAQAHARHVLEASQLAQQKIAEFVAVRDASVFNTTGDFGEEWPGYAWQTRGGAADFGLYTVTVEVFWAERGQQRSVSAGTIIYPLSGTDEEETDDTSTSTGTTGGG